MLARKTILGFVLALTLLSTLAGATPVTVGWTVTVTSKYDYAAGGNVPFDPISGPASVTFDNVVTSVTDYGTTTITRFGDQADWTTPVTSLIGPDPYGAGLGGAYSYVFPNVSDYSSTFLEEAAWQANTYSPTSNGMFWAYHAEIRARRYSPSRGGTGAADYAFTPETLLAFLRDFAADGELAYFNESYQLYDRSTSSYLAGYSWSGVASISNIVDHAAPVPEPTTIVLLGAGLAGLAMARKRIAEPR